MASDLVTSVGGVGVGVGSTLAIRSEFDQSGEITILRPSVLWGLGTGIGALALPTVMGMMGNGRAPRGAFWEFVEDYGEAALTAGLFSTFAPKGGGVQLPSV